MTRNTPGRRLIATTLCTIGAATGALAVAGPAQAEVRWADGEPKSSVVRDCVSGLNDYGATAYVSFQYDTDAPPTTGAVFYGRTVAAVLNTSCSPQAVRLEVTPPPGTSIAISPSTPVRCFTRDNRTAEVTPMPASRCPQTTSPPLYGGAVAFDPADQPGDGTWDVPDGTAVEIQFPMVASMPLVGIGADPCHCITGFTKVIDTNLNPILRPQIGAVVAAAPVAPSAPAPPAPKPAPSTASAPGAATGTGPGGGSSAGTSASKQQPAGKCSKLKGKKRTKCIKQSCGKLKGAKKRACVTKVTRKASKSKQ